MGGGEKRCYCSMGIEFQVCKMKRSGDSFHNVIYLTQLNYTFKMVKMVNFVIYFTPQFKKS